MSSIRKRLDYVANLRLSGRFVALGLGFEAAALIDIFVIRRDLRLVGGGLIVAGCLSLTTAFVMDWLGRKAGGASMVATARPLIGAVAFAAMALLQLAFTVLSLGPEDIRKLLTGPVMAALVVAVVAVLFVDAFLPHQRGQRL